MSAVTTAPLTYRLPGYISVLARMDRGESVPYTFAQRAQAEKHAVDLQVQGFAATVIQRGRPFYVKIAGAICAGCYQSPCACDWTNTAGEPD